MSVELIKKLSGCRDLKAILETAIHEVKLSLKANSCQILLANPLDPHSALICEAADNKDIGAFRQTFPLILNGRSFGSLTLSRNTEWLDTELDSTLILISKLSELIRQSQLNDVVQRDTFRRNFLIEVSNLMSYSPSIGDALFMVVGILGKALHASRCLFVFKEDKTVGWKCYEFCQPDQPSTSKEYRWPNDDSSLVAQTLSSRHPLKFVEGQENSYLAPVQVELRSSRTRSLLALPLRHEISVYGCLFIQQCDYRRDWTLDEIDAVQGVADRVAEALFNLAPEKQIHKPIVQLKPRIVSTTEQPDSAAYSAHLIQSLKNVFGTKKREAKKESKTGEVDGLHARRQPSIVPIHHRRKVKDQKTTVEEKSATETAELPEQVGEQISEPITEQTAEIKIESKAESKIEPKVEPKVEPTVEKADLDAIPTPLSGPAKSGLAGFILPKGLPEISKRLLKGIKKKDKDIDKEQVVAQTQVDTQYVDDLAKEKLEKALASTKEDKKNSEYIFALPDIDMRTLGRIDSWINTIEQKDKYLSPHAVAVAEYSYAIAKKLNLPDKEKEEIKLAALLHDVGKLGISAEILQKNDDELDDAGLLTMMKHPLDGAELLKSSPDLAHLAPIVLAHHEEYNGDGYPEGLRGENIPLAARIIFLANSYHTLISDTHHSKALTNEAAQERIKQGSGKQYDPHLVDVFLKYLHE